MRFLRSSLLLALIAFAATATTSAAGVAKPGGLHGFLLRADEPSDGGLPPDSLVRVEPRARRADYQFQLSTSSTFRDNGILYNNSSLTTPVAAPTLTLPWITGSPHALYARVRAVHRLDDVAVEQPRSAST